LPLSALHVVAAMTEKQVKTAIKRLRQLDPDELRRVVGEAVIQIQVRLRNEGVEFETEFGGEMYRQ
jgi:hypothetical protein